MSSARHDKLKRRRTLWMQIHLWIGLSIGLLTSVIGITGSISVFYQELDQWLNPDVLSVSVDPRGALAYKPLQEILDASSSIAQPLDKRLGIQFPRVNDSTYGIGYVRPANKANNTTETWVSIRVNPYTAKVTGTRTFPLGAGIPPGIIDFLAVLHYRLLLDDFWGGTIVAIVGLIGIFSLLTGLILWWPLTGKWLQALTVKWPASSKRINFDIHKILGIYFCLILAAVLISGVYMNLNKQFVALVQVFSPDANKAPVVNFDRNKPTISIAKAAEIAEKSYPEGQANSMADENENGQYLISRRHVSSTSHFWAERVITIEAQIGKIINVLDATTRRTAGEAFLDWQWPLHSGKAFGWTGRILVFLSGLVCPVIFCEGFGSLVTKTPLRLFFKTKA